MVKPQTMKTKIIKTHTTEKGGIITIYQITSNSLINDFYLVTFDDGYSEEVWGIGSTPETALESASRTWGNDDNPFKEYK
jgi:hypothetical protein